MAVIAEAQAAINTLWQVGDYACPQGFHTVANVGDLTGPTLSGQVQDVTSHSTGSPWRRKVVTLLDNGDVSLPVFFVPSSSGTDNQFGHNGTDGLLSIFTNRQLREYKMKFPDAVGTSWYMQAFMSKFSMKAPVAGVLAADSTFTCTDEPIFV